MSSTVQASVGVRLSKLVGFALTAKPEESRAFYEGKLGLQFLGDDGFALVFKSGEFFVRVSKMKTFTPVPYTVLGWEVEDIHAAVAALNARGIVFERFPGLPHGDDGICTFPDGSAVAWFKDPDGSVLSLSHHSVQSS